MLSLIIGLITMGLSVVGIILWKDEFLFVLRGAMPVCFLLGGLVAAIAGASSIGRKPLKIEETQEKK
jgi:hypothetical protein